VPAFTRTAAAERDLSEIWDYIAEDNEAAAGTTLRKLDAACALLANHSKMGRDRSDLVPGVRSFPVGNYLIFYRETGQGLEVIRVLHGARNLDRIEFDPDAPSEAP
jgi:toxin ParE1/3/4